MGNVVSFNGDVIDNKDVPPDEILESAKGTFSEVLVVGYNKDRKLTMIASNGYMPDMLWLLEGARRILQQEADQE